MAKSSRGGRRAVAGGSISQSHTGIQLTGSDGGASGATYGSMDDTQAQGIISANADTYKDPDFKNAQKLYISDTDVNGDGYSYSQNLNYKLDNGIPLDVNEKYIDDNIQFGMHDIGANTTLYRACHDDILKQCGISDYSKLSDSQLQSRLVGTEFSTTSYMSTSYNAAKNPFMNGTQSGGREVYMNINAHAGAKMIFGSRPQSEIVLNKGTRMRITGIHYDGSYATPRGSMRSKPRVIIDIETYD